MTYRAEIDGLRALAVMAVIAHHAGAPLKGGFLGVDIFFVISGYLITTILLGELRGGSFSLIGFYKRRARRLLPALVLVVAVSIPVAWIVMTPDQMKLFGQGLVALGAFGTNALYWWKTGYFSPAAGENPLVHTWSLAVEEQFYLLFPLALLWLWRRDRVGLGLGLALVAGLVLAELAARLAPAAAFYLLPFRAWELLAGCLAAVLVTRFGLPATGNVDRRAFLGLWEMLARRRGVVALAGLGSICASLLVYHAWLPIPGLWLAAPVGGTVLVILCAGPGTWAHWVLSSRPAVGLGLISYAAYLWHQPVFAFARLGQLDPPGPTEMFGLTILVLGLAWATWAFVETPCRRGLRLRPLFVAAGTAWGGAVTLGLALHVSSGLGSVRYDPAKIALFESAAPSPMRSDCHGMPGEIALDDACILAGDAVGWAVLGDSHGVEISYALAERLVSDHPGSGVVQLTASGCPPALGFTTTVPGCAEWTEAVVKWLEARPDLPVLLAYRHNAYLFGKNEGLYPDLPDTPYKIGGPGDPDAKRARYFDGFGRMVARLARDGRRVVVMAPVPEIARSITKYVRLDGSDGSQSLAAVPKAYHLARTAWMSSRLSEMGVELFDPAKQICDEAMCYGVRNGEALYFDDNHLSVSGAFLVIGALDLKRHHIQAVERLSTAPPIQKTSTAGQNPSPPSASNLAAARASP